MFKIGRRIITLAIEAQKTNAFATILEDKNLFTGVSAWRKEDDKEYRIYEFEATAEEYDAILDDLDVNDIKYKVCLTDLFGRKIYIGLI